MSKLFGASHRTLQDHFDTRRLADRLEALTLKRDLSDEKTRSFIESRDMFFLASVGANGRPTCSYKGGSPGFVRVVDASTIAFPDYNGDGMYLSLGNVAETREIGLLFIDFETPFRIRMQGRASLVMEGPLVDSFEGAEMAVSVAVSAIWPNCPRYVHRYAKMEESRYVPKSDGTAPLAEWKRVDAFQDVLSVQDQERVARETDGTISGEEWREAVRRREG
jgi:uncharacterized protein